MNNKITNNSLPSVTINYSEIEKGLQAYKLFSYNKILCNSNSDARRLIQQGAAKINGKKISDFNLLLTTSDIQEKSFIQISIGKKKHALIKITQEY